ncbi:MAG: NTP transferase domain-containing protein [Bdellovibrionales bacterium]|nr:NTP transferase domain-containing protein [Bdellovibrionales bacterium]
MNSYIIGIQARTNSTRLPGKIYYRLGEKSVLEHSYDTCKNVLPNHYRPIVLGIASDTKLKEFVNEKGLDHYFATCDENDLLGRYLEAVRACKAKGVIRITADCPLIDQQWIERVATALLSHDYVTNTTPRTVIDGDDVQAISAKALEWYAKTLKSEEHLFYHLEHDPSIRRLFDDQGFSYQSLFSQDTMIPNPYHPDTKMSVDTIEDLEKVRKIYETSKPR